MDVEWVRQFCLSLPHTTESLQWGNDLVFKIAGKMYAVAALDPGEYWLSFKCSAEDFAALTERPGIDPAPYLARAHWVALVNEDALPRAATKNQLRTGYDLVLAKLPKKIRQAMNEPAPAKKANGGGRRTA
jgi:predicted DNA-binding protein (MmcQ/YjbR family)